MSRLASFIFRHHIALLLLIAIFLLHGTAHFILFESFSKRGIEYYPTLVNLDERHFTTARVNEVFINGEPAGDVNVWEYQDSPNFLPPIPHLIAGYFARFVGDIQIANMLGDALFPIATFFFLYLLFFEITRQKTGAIFFAMFSIILPRYLAFFPLFSEYYQSWFLTKLILAPKHLPLDRFEDPLLTLPFFILALYLIYRTIQRNERITCYLAGISFGILFYTYFYYVAYLGIALVFLLGIAAFSKKWSVVKNTAIIIGLGLLISIPYWISFFAVQALPSYSDLALRLGPEHTHKPLWYPRVLFFYVQHAVLAILFLFLYRNTKSNNGVWFASLLLPVFVIYNFQIITGFNPQPDHWIKPQQVVLTLSFFVLAYYFLQHKCKVPSEKKSALITLTLVIPLSIIGITTESTVVMFGVFGIAGFITLLYILWGFRYLFNISHREYLIFLLWIAIGLLFIKGMMAQENFIEESKARAMIPQYESESFKWLNENTQPGSVVGTPSFLSNTYLANLTFNNLYAPNGLTSIAPNEEITKRFMEISHLFMITSDVFAHFFATEETYPPASYEFEGLSYLYGDMLRAKQPGSIFTNKGFLPPYISDEDHTKLLEQYQEYTETALPIENSFHLDYLYLGPRERLLGGNIKETDSIKLIYENEMVQIFSHTKRK